MPFFEQNDWIERALRECALRDLGRGKHCQKKIPCRLGLGIKDPIIGDGFREGQTLPAGDAEAMTGSYGDDGGLSVASVQRLRNSM